MTTTFATFASYETGKRIALVAATATAILTSWQTDARSESGETTYHHDGRVSAFGTEFASVEDYHQSVEFRESGRRCGAPEPLALGPALEFAPTDCSLSQTSVADDYDPAQGQEYVIQVVVHVLSSNGTGDLSEALVTSQIDILNEDFGALAGTPGAPGNDGKIRFVLASTDPNGNPTNGINRVGQFFNNADAATQLAWDPDRYLNIYSANLGGGILGYVQGFPQSIAGQQNDGVWSLYTSVGRNSPGGGRFNQGRTITHEVGHYMGLRHIWGDESSCNNGYNSGDLVADTVPSTSPSSGCDKNRNTCGQGNAVENYMDYSDDTCMDHFSPEQINRMRCVMVHYRSELYNALPMVDFTFEPSELSYSFTDLSSDADGTVVSWEWDFGDGGTSTEQNPTHTYADWGIFDVTLTVSDDRGVRAAKTLAVSVNIAPSASFDHDADGLAVSFTDTSSDANGTITSWEWDFGDGDVSTEASPSHTYATLSAFNVSLTVTDDLGAKTTVTVELDLEQEQAEGEGGLAGCGCSSTGSGDPLGLLALLGLAMIGWRTRRRKP